MARVERNCDALILVSPDFPNVSAALSVIAQRKPVIAMITDLVGSRRLAYVGMDNYAAGRLAGDLVARFLVRERREVALRTETNAMLALRERENGFRDVVAERHPRCEVVGVLEASDDVRVTELLRDLIERRPELAGLYVVSTGNRAVAATLAALGRTYSTTVITHELTPVRRRLLKAGAIDAIIDQNPELEAQTAVELAAS
jgi:LacI family transcriptional regulator